MFLALVIFNLQDKTSSNTRKWSIYLACTKCKVVRVFVKKMNRKGDKSDKIHASRSRKRKFHGNRYSVKQETSWCVWRRCESKGKLIMYKRNAPLTPAIQNAIKPAYEDLSKHDLQQRCLAGNIQNNNESFNGLHFASKHLYCGKKPFKLLHILLQ